MTKPTKVAILDGGALYAKEYQVFWNLPSELPISMPTYSVLIDHADGLYLYDSGFDLKHFQDNFVGGAGSQTKEQTIPAQFDLLGLKPTDVNYVINSHFHFDHCAGNKFCRHAKTICHKCELEASFNCQPFEKFVYSDRSFVPPDFDPEKDLSSIGFECLTGDQEIAKGIHLFETPGHTLGHYSLMVTLPGRRPMLFTGDASYAQRNLDNMHVTAAHLDPVQCLKSMQRLKDIALKYDAEFFFPHDEMVYGSYLKAPAWYE